MAVEIETLVAKLQADNRQLITAIKQVERRLDRLDAAGRRSAERLSAAFGRLRFAINAVVASMAAREVVRFADTYKNLQARIGLVVDSSDQLAAVMERLRSMAQETGSSFEATADMYARIGVAAKELGVSQEELLRTTETINKALIVGGISSQEAAAGLIQLAQGLASGTLRGDELRSVLEQMPPIADAIAREMGITRGELRKMGEEGKITADIVIQAMINQGKAIDEAFGKMPMTVGRGLQRVLNSIFDMIGKLDAASGASSGLGDALSDLASTIDLVTASLTGNLTQTDELSASQKELLVTIAALVGVLRVLWEGLEVAADAVVMLGKSFGALGAAIAAVLRGDFDLAGKIIKEAQDDWRRVFEEGNREITEVVQGTADTIVQILDEAARKAAGKSEDLGRRSAEGMARARRAAMRKLRAELEKDIGGAVSFTLPTFAIEQEIKEVSELIEKAKKAWPEMVEPLNAALEMLRVQLRQTREEMAQMNGLTAEQRLSWDQLQEVLDEIDPARPLRAQARELEYLITLWPQYSKQLQQALEDVNYRIQQIEEEQKALEGLTAAQRARYDDLRRVIEAADPMEPLRRELEDLDRLLQLFPDHAEIIMERMLQINEQMDQMGEEQKRQMDELAKAGENLAQAIGTAFEDAIIEGKNFGDVLRALEQDIIRIVTRTLVTKPLERMVSGFAQSFLGGVFGGGGGAPTPRQHGGFFAAGQQLLVGENGPEVVRFPRPGYVAPRQELRRGGGAGRNIAITVNINNPQSGEDVRVAAGQAAAQLALAVQRGGRNL